MARPERREPSWCNWPSLFSRRWWTSPTDELPQHHHLNQSEQAQALIRTPTWIVGLEVADFWNTVNLFIDNGLKMLGTRQSRVKPAPSSYHKLGRTQSEIQLPDFQRFQSVDISMVATRRPRALFHRCREVRDLGRSQGRIREARRTMKKAWAQSRERAGRLRL